MQNIKRRKPIIALLLSFIQPGLGQMYNGQLKKGIIFSLGYALLVLLSITVLFCHFIGMFVSIFCLCVLIGFGLGDAFSSAHKIKELELKPYNKWYLYIFVVIIFSFSIALLAENIRFRNFKAYKIPSGAMEPTLLVGDHIIADLKCYESTKPKRGDVIIFAYPKDTSKDFIKRVIGLEGDKIFIKDKMLYINDRPYFDPYGVYADHSIIPGDIQPRDNFGPVIVPKDSYFVLGDNRDRSADSRFWGFVESRHIKGKALYIYFSWGGWGGSMQDIKWRRIGAYLKHGD